MIVYLHVGTKITFSTTVLSRLIESCLAMASTYWVCTPLQGSLRQLLGHPTVFGGSARNEPVPERHPSKSTRVPVSGVPCTPVRVFGLKKLFLKHTTRALKTRI